MRNRKVQVSLSIDSNVVSALDDLMESGEWNSRSQLIQDLIRRGLEVNCSSCESLRLLVKSGLVNLPYGLQFPLDLKETKLAVESGTAFDEITLITGKKVRSRTKEKMLRDGIEACADNMGVANRADVLDKLTTEKWTRQEIEDLIDKMVQTGGLLRPRGYDTLMNA